MSENVHTTMNIAFPNRFNNVEIESALQMLRYEDRSHLSSYYGAFVSVTFNHFFLEVDMYCSIYCIF